MLPFLALATIPFCLFCLTTSVSDLRTYPGVDLRGKVVGARLLVAGLDPYDTKGNLAQENDYFRVDIITYTPALLALYVPLSSLPFATQRTVYYCMDWLYAAAAFYLLQRYFCRSRLQKYMCWIVYAAFIFCSFSFRLHLERGQYYMLLLLLMCHAAVCIKNERTAWLSCVPTALLLLLRPTYGLMLLVALICLGARKWALRVTIIAALMFFITLQFGGVQRWLGFIRSAHERQMEHLSPIAMTCRTTQSSQQSWPELIIEHIDFSKYLRHPAVNGTFIGLFGSGSLVYKRFPAVCGVLSPKWINSLNSVFMALVLIGGMAVAFIARQRIVSRNILIAFMVLWPLIFEIFGPERYLYTAVVEVQPLILVLFDQDNFKPELRCTRRFYFLLAILVLGILPPIVHQIVHHLPLIIPSLVSILILLLLPISLGAFCVYSIYVSPKRIGESPSLPTAHNTRRAQSRSATFHFGMVMHG